MTARGVDFLSDWLSANLPTDPANRNRAAKLLAVKFWKDFEWAGFTPADLENKAHDIEEYILSAMIHGHEPGTPGD